jgi:LacI family transcriptional regulator
MDSLKDVAKKAHVAVSTASLALNGKARVSPATRARVLKAAKDLGYYPHAIARSLKKRKTETIGLFMKDFSGPVYNELIQAVRDVLAAHHFDLIVCFSHSSHRFLQGRQIDGAIVLDPLLSNETIREIGARRCPVVVLDRLMKGPGVHTVLLDNEAGSRAMATHLLGLGYDDFLFAGGPSDSFDSAQRLAGFSAATGGARAIRRVEGDFTEAGGQAIARGLIDAGKLPRTVFCANDETAVGVMAVLQESGVRIPADVAVTGFDDIRLARHVSPRLSTVRVPRYTWGATAARTLLAALAEESPAAATLIDVSLVIRESCGGSEAPSEHASGGLHV